PDRTEHGGPPRARGAPGGPVLVGLDVLGVGFRVGAVFLCLLAGRLSGGRWGQSLDVLLRRHVVAAFARVGGGSGQAVLGRGEPGGDRVGGFQGGRTVPGGEVRGGPIIPAVAAPAGAARGVGALGGLLEWPPPVPAAGVGVPFFPLARN